MNLVYRVESLDDSTHDIEGILSEEAVPIFPRNDGVDLAFRVLVKEDVKGDPGLHKRGLDKFRPIIDC